MNGRARENAYVHASLFHHYPVASFLFLSTLLTPSTSTGHYKSCFVSTRYEFAMSSQRESCFSGSLAVRSSNGRP